jgi:hypothetical protein
VRIRSFRVLPSVVALLAAAMPADASPPDSWEGNLFLRDVTDLLAFPHRAMEDRDFAVGTHVPSVSPGVGRFGDEAENSLDVSGLLCFGLGERFSLFLSANDPRGYNPTAGFVVQSVRGPGAALSEGSFALSHQTRGLATSGTPDEKMQVGLAFSPLPTLDVGAFFGMGKYEWKGTITPAAGTATTSGRETGYFDVTGSAGWTPPGGGPLDKVELSVSYAKGEQDEFGLTTLSGSGDNSSYGGAGFVHFSSTLWGWKPIVTAGYVSVKSDFTYYQDPAITTPVPTLDAEETALNVAVGGTRAIGTGGKVAATLGIVRFTDKFEAMQVSGFDSIVIDETTTVNPSCSFAVDVPLFSKLSLASGVDYEFGAFEGDTDETVAALTDHTTEDDKDLAANWSAGLIWSLNQNVQVSATMHDDAWTSNPIRGDNEDEWVGVLRTQFSF